MRRLSDTTQPLSMVTPYWTSEDVTTDPDVTLEGSSAVDRIAASSTMHDWIQEIEIRKSVNEAQEQSGK